MTTKWTAADLPDLIGKTIVVTGSTAGIGVPTARELARAGAHVVMAVRDEAKGADVARSFGTTRGEVEVRRLDVSSLASIRAFADSWTGPLDVLINNAGIMMVPLAYTSEGLETQMATNYFGPFALTNALLPHITDRVVSISSQLHRFGRARIDDLNWKTRKYDELGAYQDSKLDIILFSLDLQRRLIEAGTTVRSVVAHPGIARTTLVTHAGGISGRINYLGPLLNDADHGALPTLFAATEKIPGTSYVGPGGLFSVKGHPKVRNPSSRARDPQLAQALWDATIKIVGPEFSFPLART